MYSTCVVFSSEKDEAAELEQEGAQHPMVIEAERLTREIVDALPDIARELATRRVDAHGAVTYVRVRAGARAGAGARRSPSFGLR